MTQSKAAHGVWCASLTPQTADGTVDVAMLAQHVKALFAAGVDGAAPFGTTGEGQSFTVAERSAALDALLKAGVPAAKLMPGIGCAALDDAVALAKHALGAGVEKALMLPPFFFKDVDDEGQYACFARAIDRIGDNRLRLFLYHIPQITLVPVGSPALARLAKAYPGVVAGLKDSLANLPETLERLKRFPDLAIFVGAEHQMVEAMRNGAVGTICGLANFAPELIRRLYDTAATAAAAAPQQQVEALIGAILDGAFLPRIKTMMAHKHRDPRWRNLRPPLHGLSAEDERSLLARISAAGFPLGLGAAAQ